MKKYEIGENRFVIVKNRKDSSTVSIIDSGSKKSVEFPFSRWIGLTRVYFPLIEDAVKQLEAGLEVCYQQHIGGKWFVSVTKGYVCIDLREFYWHPTLGQRPTKKGIALRLHEWKKLVEIVPEIHRNYPTIETTPMCWDREDHNNPDVQKSCAECNPFQFDPGYVLFKILRKLFNILRDYHNVMFILYSLSFCLQVRFSDAVDQRVLVDWPPEDYRDARVGPWFRYAIERRRAKKEGHYNT